MTERTCFLCEANGYSDPLDKHHCLRGKNRKLAEKYGLYVYLCHSKCHLYGEGAAHNSKKTERYLQQWAQKKAMEENGWTVEEFIKVFGRNYLDEEVMF